MAEPLKRNADRAAQAGRALRRVGLGLLGTFLLGGALAQTGGPALAVGAGASAWGLFALFTLYFFRDPPARAPHDPDAVVAPAHGRVDCVEETVEPEFIGGPCRRISIFLSVFDVHVQSAPVSGSVVHLRRRPGQFLSALRSESATHNESVLIGMEWEAQAGQRIALRQIAGVIARRILTWVEPGERVGRGERVGMIQFGSRCDLYLPLTARITVKPGDKVAGGETVVAGCWSTPGQSARAMTCQKPATRL